MMLYSCTHMATVGVKGLMWWSCCFVSGMWSQWTPLSLPHVSCCLFKVASFVALHLGVPRWQPHRRSGLATLPSVGAVP